MHNTLGLALALIAALLLCGCPQPVSEQGGLRRLGTNWGEQPVEAAGDTAPAAAEAENAGPLPDSGSEPADEPAAEDSAGLVGPQPLMPTAKPAGSLQEQLPAGPTLPDTPENAESPQPAGPQPPATPGPQVTPPPSPEYGALDAENFMGDAPPDTAWGQPKPELSADALAFAGRWQVVVVQRAGEARLIEDADEWLLALEGDGRFYAKQRRGGQEWRQTGGWSIAGAQLKLESGPGGERSFEIIQELSNICVLRDSAREVALFCVRQQQQAAPQVAAKYDSDFGPLNLRPSGPGHYRSGYGDPPGTLVLAQLGSFLVGTWEQAPSRGFAIFELRSGGFSGAWWYAQSSGFDGRWLGVAAQ